MAKLLKTVALSLSWSLLALAGADAQTPEVRVEFRMGSSWIADNAAGPEVPRVAELLKNAASTAFGHVAWVPGPGTVPGAPRLVLTLSQGAIGACEPPEIRLALSVETGGVATPVRSSAQPFLRGCAVDWPGWPPAKFNDELGKQIERFFAQADTVQRIEDTLLAGVPLAKRLDPDETRKRLFLPQELHAALASQIEVTFGPTELPDGRMFLHPSGAAGGRTLLLVKEFLCGDISTGGPVDETWGKEWHDRLPDLLRSCPGPTVFMKRFVRAPAGGNVTLLPPTPTAAGAPAGGVVTDLGGGDR